MLRGRWRAVLAAMVIIPVLAGAVVLWRATRVRDGAAAEVAARGDLPFRLVPLTSAAAGGVETISANPAFRDMAPFQGKIAVSARAGLFLYHRDGTLESAFRAGRELPPAELGPMAAGFLAGSGGQELLIGTRGAGLLMYNGSRFQQLLPEDPAVGAITAVLSLASGRVLLGTERRGVLAFDGHRLRAFHDRLSRLHITALAGSEGDLWIGAHQDGVFRLHAGQLDDLRESLPDAHVLALLAEDGSAWVGTPLGVVEFHRGRRARLLAEGFFARALVRRGQTLYAGTEDEGIVELPLERRHTPRAPQEAVQAPVRRLSSIDGELFAVRDDAIDSLAPDRGHWQRMLVSAGAVLTDRNVAALGVSEGRLWVGYFDRGLDVLSPDLSRAGHYEDDHLFCINRITVDPHGNRTAVATANGLVLFEGMGRPRQVLGRKDGLLADHVTDVAFREQGMVVATGAGLSFVDRAGVRSLYAFHGLVNNHVYTVAAQGSTTIAGTLGGVSVLQDDAVRANYTTANSHLRHNWITAVTRVGDEWFVGTYGAGVLRFSHDDWRRFDDLPAGLVVNPNAMLAQGGKVLAGSLNRGLFIYDRSSGRWTSTLAGLPSPNVSALASYGGYVYVGTDNGLVRIPEGALP